MAVIATASGSRPSAQANTLGSGCGRISSEITLVSSNITADFPWWVVAFLGLPSRFSAELSWGWLRRTLRKLQLHPSERSEVGLNATAQPLLGCC
jgi:hypothetical protein